MIGEAYCKSRPNGMSFLLMAVWIFRQSSVSFRMNGVIGFAINMLDVAPAVRPTTEKLADYRRIQRELAEENKLLETP